MDKDAKRFAVEFMGVNKYTPDKFVYPILAKFIGLTVKELNDNWNRHKVIISNKNLGREFTLVESKYFFIKERSLKS